MSDKFTPTSKEELLARAEAVAGLSLAGLAQRLDIAMPSNSTQGKGFVGQLLELWLGATAGSLPQPDFQQLGIELKTIPINAQAKPIESTYVSIVPLRDIAGLSWEQSDIYKKLQHILWIPILTEKGLAIGERIIGSPILWQPSPQQAVILQQDWEELMDMVAMGEIEHITARLGTYLQIRPKGANASALTQAIGPEGESIMTLPRGFYLRTCFTQQILMEASHINSI